MPRAYNITAAIRLAAEAGNVWYTTDAEVSRAVREYLKYKKAADAATAAKNAARDAILASREDWAHGEKLRTPAGTATVSITRPTRVDSKLLATDFPVVYAKVSRQAEKPETRLRVNGA